MEGDSRWDAIWQLVLQAEQLPPGERAAFLQSTQNDSFIIRQAAAILEGSESLATAASLQFAPQERFAPQVGMKIGRYRVGTLLGSGGAGSVYAAFDEDLNRPVAIKFLPVRRSGTDAPALPLREARAASALNHPNIIMIHEVVETSETAAIVMELVKGVTLREAARKRPPLHEVLDWSTQLANALAVAHEHGLIHGDIKPENVMVRDDGYIKLLDFGLAFDTQPSGAQALQFGGTLRYLAPERCLGQPATQASDVFAFGVILYELATGRYPFQSQTTSGLLHVITEEEAPRPSKFRPDVPAALDSLVAAMLGRRAEDRPTARQVAARLTESAQLRPRRSSTLPLAFAVIALAAILAGTYWFRSPARSADFSHMTVRPLASQTGLEDNPSISPDGLWVSCLYRAQAFDHPKLQVHSLQGGPPLEIATGGLIVQGPAAWSPDSRELAFEVLESEALHVHALYRVSRSGGVPRRIAECKSRNNTPCEPDWSPDGNYLAVADQWQNNSELYLVDLAHGGRKELITPVKETVSRPRFSPDGNWIAYSREVSLTSDDLYIVAAAGGQPRRITKTPWFQKGFAWSRDGKRLVAISSRLSRQPEIFEFPLDGSEPFRAGELDVTRGTEPTLSREKGSLAWVRDLSANSIWRMPVDQSRIAPQSLTSSSALDIDAEWSGTGRMVFRSNRSGNFELWIANDDGSRPWQATRFRGPFVGDPHWSPDGRAIAFTSHAGGSPDIYVMRCEQDSSCGEPRRLTQNQASDANPTWSQDGRWIYFTSSRSGKYEVWRMPAGSDAEPERVTWNGGYMARESADGKWLYYSKLVHPTTGFWRIALPIRGPNQQETLVVPRVPFRAAASWALGASELFYYPAVESPQVPFPPVRAADVETGRTRDISVGDLQLGRGLSLSPDGRWILRSQIDRALTLIMVAE
jgi:Tol biopolymer transport system component